MSDLMEPPVRPTGPITCNCYKDECDKCRPWKEYMAKRKARTAAGLPATDKTIVAHSGWVVSQNTPVVNKRYCSSKDAWPWSVSYCGMTEEGVGQDEDHADEMIQEAKKKLMARTPGDKVINIPVGGIGDSLCALAVAAGMGPTATVSCPPHRAEWLALFSDRVVSQTLTIDLSQYREEHREKLPRWEKWGRDFGVHPVLPPARPLPAEALWWAVPNAGRVVIAPFAAHADRSWPVHRWLMVEKLLIEKHGFRCVILDDGPEARTQGFQSPVFRGEPARHVAALIQHSPMFLGNDSGMAHVAGFLRRPGIAVCSHTSDRNIFALYPTITEIGGRGQGFGHVTPEDVVSLALIQIRQQADWFPFDEFVSVMVEKDRYRAEAWVQVYTALWQEVRKIAPKKIVEIGTRAGYSAWTMLRACPEATVVAFDLDCDEHGGYKGAHENARRILPADRFELTIKNSHDIDRLPECDLVYVDGDHTEDGAMQDLELAIRSGARKILLDDVTNLEEVRRAGDRFCDKYNLPKTFIPSMTGLYRIDVRP